MKRALLVVAMLVAFVFVFNYAALATSINVVEGKAKNVHQQNLKFDKKSVSKLSKAEGAAQELPVLFEDDFENMEVHWIPDASWNHVDEGNGRAFQPETSWRYVDTNSHSPTHSWNAIEDLDQELDFLFSPVISLPDEVEVAGKVSPLKGLKISHWLDVDTPDGGEDPKEHWQYYVGPAEVWWQLTDQIVGAGASAYYLDVTSGSSDLHWRQWLVTPEIDLTSATGTVNLTFMHLYQNEKEFDYYAVDISTDDFISYTNLGHWGEAGESGGWLNETFDISAWVGQKVKIRFSSKGDYGTAEGGWVVDEVKVTDDTGDLFYDDGGEDGTMKMTAEGWTSGLAGSYGYFHTLYSDVAQPTPNWIELEPFEVEGFNTNYGPGSDIRMAIQWFSDGGDPQGRGLFIDDVTLYGVGLLPQDIGIVGVKGLLTAALDRPFMPALGVGNVGIEPLNGAVIWTANVVNEADETVHVLASGQTLISDFKADSVLWIPTMDARAWVPKVPGYYTLQFKVIFADGDPKNNEAEFEVLVPGGPWATPLYRCDFEPYAGETSLEDFGWTVVNGGGNDLTGLNKNKWEYLPFIYGDGAATLSVFWGAADPGPDAAMPPDSSEVLDEYLISPPIDVSMLNPHNTLGLQFFEYFRSGYPGYDAFGVAWSHFTIDWSVDGENWNNTFTWVDHDSLPGNGPRLPNYFYGTDNPVPYYSKIDLDITEALIAAKRSGTNTVYLRFGTWCENSWFVASSLDEIMVYAGISKPIVLDAGDVPMDQGKQAYLIFKGSYNDMVYNNWGVDPVGDVVGVPVNEYHLWRGTEVTGGTSTTTTFSSFKELFDTVANPKKGDVYAVEGNNLVWSFVGAVPATDLRVYGATIPTLWDGVETAVMIVARTEVPNIWSVSDQVMVTTEDNLAPSAPGGLMAQTEEGMTKNVLTWEEAYTPVQDVNYYTVYRTEQPGVYGEPLATTIDLSFVDETVEVGHSYYYVVTATDFAGNESQRSNETSVVTSVGSKPAVPTDFALDQNYPNPFNPSTTVEFALPHASNVVLTVYNTSGQAIETVYEGRKEAGYHKITWDASRMSAGIYFLEMRADNFTKMIKMTLVK